jgi:hypothetical protein
VNIANTIIRSIRILSGNLYAADYANYALYKVDLSNLLTQVKIILANLPSLTTPPRITDFIFDSNNRLIVTSNNTLTTATGTWWVDSPWTGSWTQILDINNNPIKGSGLTIDNATGVIYLHADQARTIYVITPFDATTYTVNSFNYTSSITGSSRIALNRNVLYVTNNTNGSLYNVTNTLSGPLINALGFSDNTQISPYVNVNYPKTVLPPLYISIYIENVGTSSNEPQKISYKIPVNSGIIYWSKNNYNEQYILNNSSGYLRILNIKVLDSYGNQLNNNGVDWSFTLSLDDTFCI